MKSCRRKNGTAINKVNKAVVKLEAAKMYEIYHKLTAEQRRTIDAMLSTMK